MKGVAVELLFDYLLTEKGFKVLRPVFDDGYDRVVDSGGKMSRVQIKSTSSKQRGSAYGVKTCGRKDRRYNDEFDFYAIYIKPKCAWMIIPASLIKASNIKITIDGKYSKYLNNWDQLR